MSTHMYMYSSTDTNMEAHALDKHTSVTPVAKAILEVIIIRPSFTVEQTASVNCGYTVRTEEILSTQATSIMFGC